MPSIARAARTPRARRTFLSVLAIVIGLALPAIVGSPASATVGHQFASPGFGAGQFTGGPSGIAVAPSTGDVLAADPGHTLPDGVTPDPRIERFDDTGVLQDAFSIDTTTYTSPGPLAVDPSSGALYVSVGTSAGSGAVLKYDTSGAFQYALDVGSSGTTINYDAPIAVDPTNGAVYALGANGGGAQVIASFSGATGAFLQSFDGTANSPDGGGFACPGSLAVDPSHNVYVTDTFCKGRVDRYTAVGTFDTTVDDGSHGSPTGITIDPTSGEAFIAEFGPAGLQIAAYTGVTRGQTFDATAVINVAQLAVDHLSGTVYSADNGAGVIARFTAFDGPTVTTDAASPVAGTSATLNGTIDPGGTAATYHFEYGTDTNYGTSTSDASAGSGSDSVPASAPITGLTPNQTYHYRIVGTNTGGAILGEDQTFITDSVPPTIVGSPSTSSMSPTTVRVHGVVNPNHTPTSWHVDYGLDLTYGSSSPDADAGAGTADAPVDMVITGLRPATTYHYRITGDNGAGGAQHGPDRTFTTAPPTPATASNVTSTHATLVGTIDPHGVATTYHFEFGLTTSYGRSTPEAVGGSTSGEKTVTTAVADLEPSTTYHVRAVATSGSDTWYGADGTFITAPLPTNTVSEATDVGTTTATLNGTVDTHGAAGTYQFEVTSLDSDYTLVTPERTLGAATGVRGVSEAVSGLPTGETFTVRVLSESQDGNGYSDQLTFTTAPLPRTFPAPPSPPASGAYGCAAPRLAAYDKKPNPGDVITITGTDLGVGGAVSLGDTTLTPTDWTPTSFSITVPDGAAGTLALTINCGTLSNTVAVTIFHAPSNAFSIAKSSVSGTAATLTVKVPGPGKVETSGAGTAAAKKTVTKASIVKVAVKLSTAGKRMLSRAKSGALKVKAKVRFTPAGGSPASKTVSVTFKRKRGR